MNALPRLHSIARDHAKCVLFSLDASARINTWNAAAADLFGYSSQEIIGEPLSRLFVAHDQPQNAVNLVLANLQEKARYTQEHRLRRGDGTYFWAELLLETESHGPIEPSGYFVMVRQLPHRTRFESSNPPSHDPAHAARLSLAGEMLSGLAHEINQPLAAAANYLRGCIRLARGGQPVTNGELIHWMGLAAEQTTRACDIVSRLGAFVKKQPSRRTSILLNALIERTVASSLASLATGPDAFDASQVSLSLDPALQTILADANQIQQVLANLIRNGIEAMRQTPVERKRLSIRSECAEDRAHILVTDCGAGISPENRQRLFEPFFTTKDTGIGLGLSISRSIIEQHRGEMTVHSTLGLGTTFRITLPTTAVEFDG